MNITFSNIVALAYTVGGYGQLTTTHTDATLAIETEKTYRVNVKVESTKEFHSIGFDLNWDGENVKPVMSGSAVVTEDGDLFEGLSYDLVANPFLSEKRVYVAKSLKNNVSSGSVGTFKILSISLKTTVIEEKLHLFIEVEEV